MTEYILIHRREVTRTNGRTIAAEFDDRQIGEFDSVGEAFEFALRHPEINRTDEMKIKAVRNDEEWWLDITQMFKEAEKMCEEGLDELEKLEEEV